MPIEIRELVIKANLTQDGNNQLEQKIIRQKDLRRFEKEFKRETKDTLYYQMEDLYHRILMECKSEIKEQLKENKNRF